MDVSKWFYRPHYTTPELDKKIEDVEKALGFKLFIWQKTYIEYGVFRQYGETTAKILRLLITPGKIVDFTEQPRGDRERFFRKELLEVKAKLNAAGVQTNEVYTNKKDLYRARAKSGKALKAGAKTTYNAKKIAKPKNGQRKHCFR